VVNLYESKGISYMRLYDADQNALEALMGSGIGLMLEVPRTSLQSLGSDPSIADSWVQTNVAPYASCLDFRYVVVGNEIHPTDPEAGSVLPAMQNVHNALRLANLDQIKVSTAIDTTLVTNSYPPSNGIFTNSAYMNPIINFLEHNNSPLLVTIYPYFAYVENPHDINLNYALFTAPATVVTDYNKGLNYQNLFDAMVDAVYAALDRAGGPNTEIVVSESGWPSAGGSAASVENAGTYYRNLISHVNSKKGTPRKPGQTLEVYLFSMFDQNLQAAGIEQNFGLFGPNMKPKYQLSFN